jgi:hypothetical protein
LRVTAVQPSGAVIHARKHAFAVGAPLSFDAEYGAISALEHLLGAVGADLVGGIQVVARRRRVEIDDIEAVVHGTLHNPMVYLRVVGESGDAGIRAIEARVYISSLDDEARVRAVWQEVLETSPIANTLRKALTLELSYQQVL